MITLTLARVRDGRFVTPDKPLYFEQTDMASRLLIPIDQHNPPNIERFPICTVHGFSTFLYLHQQRIEVTDFFFGNEGFVNDAYTRTEKTFVQVLVEAQPNGLVVAIGSKQASELALKQTIDYATIQRPVDAARQEFDLEAISLQYARSQWKRGFETRDGYVKSGTIYGDGIEGDDLYQSVTLRGFANEVGVTLNLQNAMLKVRVLRGGRVQFVSINLEHIASHQHPSYGDPWPLVYEGLQTLLRHTL